MKYRQTQPIYVTESFTPPLEEYVSWLKKVWDSKWLTNRGDLIQLLESQIKQKYSTSDLLIVNNGTIALQLALSMVPMEKKEIITTPFSYVATTSSIVWEGRKPIFADIDPRTLCIDPTEIEKKITKDTGAILGTHVFGNVCDVHKINQLAEKYNLMVIYDAAHSFGSELNGTSVFNFGDISTTSFHATKLFHTAEGGAIFCKDKSMNKQIFRHHNFGHDGPENFVGVGINGKLSEINAALGLSILPYIDEIIQLRKVRTLNYEKHFRGSVCQLVEFPSELTRNYAYMPILLPSEDSLVTVMNNLAKENIFPRRYFYPSLETLPYIEESFEMPVSSDIAQRILCLPLSHSLDLDIIDVVCDIVLTSTGA